MKQKYTYKNKATIYYVKGHQHHAYQQTICSEAYLSRSALVLPSKFKYNHASLLRGSLPLLMTLRMVPTSPCAYALFAIPAHICHDTIRKLNTNATSTCACTCVCTCACTCACTCVQHAHGQHVTGLFVRPHNNAFKSNVTNPTRISRLQSYYIYIYIYIYIYTHTQSHTHTP
jgi:hypothetical protein